MVDFFPEIVKYATRAHAKAVLAGDTDEMSHDHGEGYQRWSDAYLSCHAEATVVGGKIVSMRVVTADGRNWFPEF